MKCAQNLDFQRKYDRDFVNGTMGHIEANHTSTTYDNKYDIHTSEIRGKIEEEDEYRFGVRCRVRKTQFSRCISVYKASERENPADELIYLSRSFDQLRSVSLARFLLSRTLARTQLAAAELPKTHSL